MNGRCETFSAEKVPDHHGAAMLTFAQEFESLSIAISAHEAAQQYAHSKQLTAVHENQQLLLAILSEHGPMTAVQCTEMTGLREAMRAGTYGRWSSAERRS